MNPALGNLAGVAPKTLDPLNLDRYAASAYLGVSVRTMAYLRTKGELLPITIAGRVLYPKTTLHEYQAQRIAASRSEGAE